MEIAYRCVRARRLGVEPRIVIPDVAAEDAPVAIRCSTCDRPDDVFEIRWHAGRLWRPCGPFAADHLIAQLRSGMRDDTRPEALRRLSRIAKGHIAITGAVHARAQEPYWLLESLLHGAPRDIDALVLRWAQPDQRAFRLPHHQEGFRADHLDDARAYAEAKCRDGRYAVLGTCEVLMPAVLRLDPERIWWSAEMGELTKSIGAAADRLPRRDPGAVAAAIGAQMRHGIEQLAAKNGWSKHTVMRLYAALTAPHDTEPS